MNTTNPTRSDWPEGAANPAGSTPIAHWGVLRAHGADAATFLHGQLTNSVNTLAGTQARLAGYCSAKGRLLASFVVWRAANGDVLLACHRSVLATTLKRLQMFVMRAKCVLSDANAELGLWGVAGAPAAFLTHGDAVWAQRELAAESTVIRLPDADGIPRALFVGPAQSPGPAPADGPALDLALDLATWRWLEIAAGVPTIEAATADQFVPQMLNFELLGGVDFQKGCYPGQEVVARSQYRGTVKRRMFRFDSPAEAAPGQELFHADDAAQPAGRVCNAAQQPGGARWALLAEVKLGAMTEPGRLHLGSADGPLLLNVPLPYNVALGEPTAV